MYNVDAFIDKNKDLLFKDLMYAMNSSTNEACKYISFSFSSFFFFFP